MKSDFLYGLCVACFSCGCIMLVTQLVTGISVATQAQCSGVEYLRGDKRNQQLSLVDFCQDNGYYTGRLLQSMQ